MHVYIYKAILPFCKISKENEYRLLDRKIYTHSYHVLCIIRLIMYCNLIYRLPVQNQTFQLQFLFELPKRLNKCIEMNAYSQAVRYSLYFYIFTPNFDRYVRRSNHNCNLATNKRKLPGNQCNQLLIIKRNNLKEKLKCTMSY